MARPAHSHYRWTVCALLFFATTISYIDRQVLSMLAKTLETHIGWTDMQYGQITGAFSLAYATGLLLVAEVLKLGVPSTTLEVSPLTKPL